MNTKIAYLYILLSAFFFALMGVFVKFADHIDLFTKIFARNIIIVIILPFFMFREKNILKIKKPKILALRIFAGLLGVVFSYWSIANMLLSEAVVLNKLSPFFIILISAVFLKEKIRPYQILSIITALLGAVILIRPEFSLEIIPKLAGIAGAIFSAIAYISISKLKGSVSSMAIVFYFGLVTSIVTLPFILVYGKEVKGVDFVYLIGIGLSSLIAQMFMTKAYQYKNASEISIVNYTNIVFSSVLAFMIWGEKLELSFFIGASLVIFAAVYDYIMNMKRQSLV